MMKIWFVLVIFGEVAATWGPLPYDMAECLNRIQEKEAELDDIFRNRNEFQVDGRHLSRKDMMVRCELSMARPG